MAAEWSFIQVPSAIDLEQPFPTTAAPLTVPKLRSGLYLQVGYQYRLDLSHLPPTKHLAQIHQ